MYRHNVVPWIHIHPVHGGFHVTDTRTGESVFAATADGVEQFAADRSSQLGHRGLGDLVHSATRALGMNRCTPCAKRQQRLNRWRHGKG